MKKWSRAFIILGAIMWLLPIPYYLIFKTENAGPLATKAFFGGCLFFIFAAVVHFLLVPNDSVERKGDPLGIRDEDD